MKIITMRQITEAGQKIDPRYESDHDDWWCVIETEEEEMVYDEYLEHPDQYEFLWNAMVKHAGLYQGLAWGEDDIYGYFRPDEDVPEVGEEFVDGDNDKWLRIE